MKASDLEQFKRLIAEFAAEGGRARAKKLTPRRRKQIARHAAQARWAKDRKLA